MSERIDTILEGIRLWASGKELLRELDAEISPVRLAEKITEAFGEATPLTTALFGVMAAEIALVGILELVDKETLVAILKKGEENETQMGN